MSEEGRGKGEIMNDKKRERERKGRQGRKGEHVCVMRLKRRRGKEGRREEERKGKIKGIEDMMKHGMEI